MDSVQISATFHILDRQTAQKLLYKITIFLPIFSCTFRILMVRNITSYLWILYKDLTGTSSI